MRCRGSQEGAAGFDPERRFSALASAPMAGALIGWPPTSNIDPRHGQSQHVSKLFQCRWQPDMGAGRRIQMKLAAVIAIGGDLAQAAPHDRTVPRLELVE